MTIDVLHAQRGKILELAGRRGVCNVRVFGLIVHGDARRNSDVDLLVDVDRARTLLDVIAFEQDLEELLGRSVEVLTDGGLSPYLRQRSSLKPPRCEGRSRLPSIRRRHRSDQPL